DRLDALTRARPPFAGLTLDRPRIMAVINVTPDSFSDGGDFQDAGAAIAHGRAMLEAGADILDIGGESTRPGADPVPPDEEIRRVEPVIRTLAAEGATVSIDTRHAAVMAAALDAGAAIVNDVTALTGDPDSRPLIAARRPPTVLMHMQGEPQTMQAAPAYADVVLDVFDHLEAQLTAARAAGLPPDRIVVDPGIGFGKAVDHNLALLREAALFQGLGCGVLIGVSRKSFIGRLSRGEPAKQRVPGSLAAGIAALDGGAQILRVHDVAETAQAVAVWRGLRSGVD
ncbi:MAG: dihydropteroate synthase, partial [Alphaproteobacteria bacterium]|nr:dihydropteroate synthase [Alphaproteobacteria bacterium]